jgi:cytoskeletal protein CcmA (bactofilin family)
VVGSITVTHRVEVGATGVVNGDITAPRMTVEDGASLRGRLKLGAVS